MPARPGTRRRAPTGVDRRAGALRRVVTPRVDGVAAVVMSPTSPRPALALMHCLAASHRDSSALVNELGPHPLWRRHAARPTVAVTEQTHGGEHREISRRRVIQLVPVQ